MLNLKEFAIRLAIAQASTVRAMTEWERRKMAETDPETLRALLAASVEMRREGK